MPAATGSGLSTKLVLMSAETKTVVVAVAVLLAAMGSLVADATVAVALGFAMCAGSTATTMLTLRIAPGAVPPVHVHTTKLSVAQLPPAVGVAATKLVPAGNGSVVDTSCASERPALVTVAT